MAATLNANALVSLDSFKAYAKEYTSDVAIEAFLRDFINEASQLCESYCNRFFRQRSITEQFNGANSYEHLLCQWPVTNITSVHIDSSRVFGASTLVDPSKYLIGVNEKGEGISIELLTQRFPRGRKNIKIVFDMGYLDIVDVPADLQLACKRTASYYYKQQQNEDFIETAKSKGGENITLIDGLPKSAAEILDKYVRMEIMGDPDPVLNL